MNDDGAVLLMPTFNQPEAERLPDSDEGVFAAACLPKSDGAAAGLANDNFTLIFPPPCPDMDACI